MAQDGADLKSAEGKLVKRACPGDDEDDERRRRKRQNRRQAKSLFARGKRKLWRIKE
jgi:hypothetical protein